MKKYLFIIALLLFLPVVNAEYYLLIKSNGLNLASYEINGCDITNYSILLPNYYKMNCTGDYETGRAKLFQTLFYDAVIQTDGSILKLQTIDSSDVGMRGQKMTGTASATGGGSALWTGTFVNTATNSYSSWSNIGITQSSGSGALTAAYTAGGSTLNSLTTNGAGSDSNDEVGSDTSSEEKTNPATLTMTYSSASATGSFTTAVMALSKSNITWSFTNNPGSVAVGTLTYVDYFYNHSIPLLTQSPNITINSPEDGVNQITGVNIDFNITSNVPTSQLQNISLYLNRTLNETKLISGLTNNSVFTKSFSSFQEIPWHVVVCDTSNNCAPTEERNLTIQQFKENSITYNATTFETKTESYSINLTIDSSITSSSATFYYNGTSYGAATKSISGSNVIFSKSFDIPLGTGTKDFYWAINLDGTIYNSTITNQEVNLTYFILTNATYQNVFLNLSFQDENTLSSINASIPSATFTYYLGSGAINKTYTFSNATDNYNYVFSGTTGSLPLSVDVVLQYKRVSDYPQRIWQPATLTLTNTTTHQPLYLLSTNDGIFVTYQVVTIGETAIQGVSVTATREVDGEDVEVAAGTTDSAGLVTFWMNPDFEHTVTFEKAEYDTFVYVHYPTQASYTITLGGTSPEETDVIRGILQTILPGTDFLLRNYNYNFSYNVSSTYYDLQSFQFTLLNSSGSVLGSNSSTSINGGVITLTNINVSTSQYITMNYVYTIDDENSTQVSGTRVWITQSTTGREFSIYQFIQDLNTYLSDGLWGFDDFGRALISLLVIVIMVGAITKKYGMNSEAAVMAVLFGIVFFLDVGLGFIPRVEIGDIVSIPYFFTYITFIIVVALIIYEERR